MIDRQLAPCPAWCTADHLADPFDGTPTEGTQHRRLIDVIPVDGGDLVSVQLVDVDYGDPADRDLPTIVTSGPPRDVMSPGQARDYAGVLIRAAGELEAILEQQQTGDVRLAGLLAEFCAWMEAAGMSRRTIRSRRQLIAQLSRHSGVPAHESNWRHVAAFLARDLKPSTRSTYHHDLMSWFDWLLRMGFRSDDPMVKLHRPRQPRRQPRPITTPQLERLLRAANRKRTRTMLLLAAYQGLRVHEIAKFRGEDIVRDGLIMTDANGRMTSCDGLRVVGKGGVEALLPLHPQVAQEAVKYPATGWWFPSYTKPDQPLSGNSVSTVIGKLAERAGVAATAHQLRHWYGTHVLRAAGGNIRVAQELLRHSSPATTAGYTYVDASERRAALLALPQVHYAALRSTRATRRYVAEENLR